MKFLLLVTLVLGSSLGAFAQDGSSQVSRFEEYFTVSEPASRPKTSSDWHQASEVLWNSLEQIYSAGLEIYSLLHFDHHQAVYGDVAEPYNRKKHFGTWISAQPNWNCFNTRAQVLERTSLVPVKMNASGCTVAAGLWQDPYSGRDYTRASDLQIDHFVPLKNAYVSGADKWSAKQRCLYANYQGNDFHLLPVDGAENSRKGDRTPEQYLPTNRAYHCQYLAQWLKTKSIWRLGLTPPEKETVVRLVKENRCSPAEMTFTVEEINAQRKYMADNKDLCQ